MHPIRAPSRPEDYYTSGEPDDTLAVERCLKDAVQIASQYGGHDVELNGSYVLSALKSVVVTPNAPLTIYGRHSSAGFVSTNTTAQFYLTGLTGAGARANIIEAAPVKSRRIRVASTAGITPDKLIEIRQYLPIKEGEGKLARWQQAKMESIDRDYIMLESGLDFPLDPRQGECTIWPYECASGLTVDSVFFEGATAILQRFRSSSFSNLRGDARFLYGYNNRFDNIIGKPSFAYQSGLTIGYAHARDRYFDFDGCSDLHADLLRSELHNVQQRNIKFAGCSYLRIKRADIYGGDYTGLCLTEGCYDVVVERADVQGSEWAVWTNGRSNEKLFVKAFAGIANVYDLNAADPLYLRRESGTGQMNYPAGSDVSDIE